MNQPKIIFAVVFSLLLFSCAKENRVKKTTDVPATAAKVQRQDSIKPLTATESSLLKKLINHEIDGQEHADLDVKNSPYSVSFPNEGDKYTVYFSILYRDDFSNDGILDYIVLRSSEGMLGGSANTNEEYLFIVMKDETAIKEQHSILGYAPFSYNILENPSFENKKFSVKAIQNTRTYATDAPSTTALSFVYLNGNVYEESYMSDCALAKLKSKTIFKPNAFMKSRNRSIDMHNYTETIREIYQSKDTLIEADLGGCDNLSLTFDTKFKMTTAQQEDLGYQKSVAMKLLQFLGKNTQFPEATKAVLDYYANNDLTDEFVETRDNYSFRILIQKDNEDKNRLRYLVQINKKDNPKQSENWDITTRQTNIR